MTRDDIIKLALKAGFDFNTLGGTYTTGKLDEHLERFANLVAAHTLANIDPSKFMSYQEGYEAAVAAEREAFADVCEAMADKHGWEGGYATECAAAIRARGETK